jgi:hypothetical protein
MLTRGHFWTNLQDGLQWINSIDIALPPPALGVRVTLDSSLDVQIVWGSFQIVAGSVSLVAGGAGTGTALSGVYNVLSTMVKAHSLYVESLLESYNFPLE